jgi:SAM-dependent methyltransferase
MKLDASLRRLRAGWALLSFRDLRVALRRCPFCGPSVIVRLNRDDSGVRCLRCAAGTVHLALGRSLRQSGLDLAKSDVCELSSLGALASHLREHARSAALSEYFADVARGDSRDGVRCEDVQQLTFADESFDLITHTEVLEHVPDDARAFAELHRVLRPQGIMLFTVPLHGGETTVERARLHGDRVEYLLPPVHHTDPLRGEGILAYRDYGRDILQRLERAGFRGCRIDLVDFGVDWIPARQVLIARRANAF